MPEERKVNADNKAFIDKLFEGEAGINYPETVYRLRLGGLTDFKPSFSEFPRLDGESEENFKNRQLTSGRFFGEQEIILDDLIHSSTNINNLSIDSTYEDGSTLINDGKEYLIQSKNLNDLNLVTQKRPQIVFPIDLNKDGYYLYGKTSAVNHNGGESSSWNDRDTKITRVYEDWQQLQKYDIASLKSKIASADLDNAGVVVAHDHADYSPYNNQLFTEYKLVDSDIIDNPKRINILDKPRIIHHIANPGKAYTIERRVFRESDAFSDIPAKWDVVAPAASFPYTDDEKLSDFVTGNVSVDISGVYDTQQTTGVYSSPVTKENDYFEVDIVKDWGKSSRDVNLKTTDHTFREDTQELVFNSGETLKVIQRGNGEEVTLNLQAIEQRTVASVDIYFTPHGTGQDCSITGSNNEQNYYELDYQLIPKIRESKQLLYEEVSDAVADSLSEGDFVFFNTGTEGSTYKPITVDLFGESFGEYNEKKISPNPNKGLNSENNFLGPSMESGILLNEIEPELVAASELSGVGYSYYNSGEKYLVTPRGGYSKDSYLTAYSAGEITQTYFYEFTNPEWIDNTPVTKPETEVYKLLERRSFDAYATDEYLYGKERGFRIQDSTFCSGDSAVELSDQSIEGFYLLDTKYKTRTEVLRNGSLLNIDSSDGSISWDNLKSNKEEFERKANLFFEKDYVASLTILATGQEQNIEYLGQFMKDGEKYYLERDIYIDSEVNTQANDSSPSASSAEVGSPMSPFSVGPQTRNPQAVGEEKLYLTQVHHKQHLGKYNFPFNDFSYYNAQPYVTEEFIYTNHKDNAVDKFKISNITQEQIYTAGNYRCKIDGVGVSNDGYGLLGYLGTTITGVDSSNATYTVGNGYTLSDFQTITVDVDTVSDSSLDISFSPPNKGVYYEIQARQSKTSAWKTLLPAVEATQDKSSISLTLTDDEVIKGAANTAFEVRALEWQKSSIYDNPNQFVVQNESPDSLILASSTLLNIRDESKNEHSITNVGGVALGSETDWNSKTIQPIVFTDEGDAVDDDKYLSIPNHRSFNLQKGDFSFEFWLKDASYTSGKDNNIISNGSTYQIALADGNKIQFKALQGSTLTTILESSLMDAAKTGDDSSWTHFAICANYSKREQMLVCALFVDGKKQKEDKENYNYSSFKNESNGQFKIGGGLDAKLYQARVHIGRSSYRSEFAAPITEFAKNASPLRYKILKYRYEKRTSPISDWLVNRNSFDNVPPGEDYHDINKLSNTYHAYEWLRSRSVSSEMVVPQNRARLNYLSSYAYQAPNNPHINKNYEGTVITDRRQLKHIIVDNYAFKDREERGSKNKVKRPYYYEYIGSSDLETIRRESKGGASSINTHTTETDKSYKNGSRLRVTKYVYRLYTKRAVLVGDLGRPNSRSVQKGWGYQLQYSIDSGSTWTDTDSVGTFKNNYFFYRDEYGGASLATFDNIDVVNSLPSVVMKTDITKKYHPDDIKFRIIKKQILELDNSGSKGYVDVHKKVNALPFEINAPATGCLTNLIRGSAGVTEGHDGSDTCISLKNLDPDAEYVLHRHTNEVVLTGYNKADELKKTSTSHSAVDLGENGRQQIRLNDPEPLEAGRSISIQGITGLIFSGQNGKTLDSKNKVDSFIGLKPSGLVIKRYESVFGSSRDAESFETSVGENKIFVTPSITGSYLDEFNDFSSHGGISLGGGQGAAPSSNLHFSGISYITGANETSSAVGIKGLTYEPTNKFYNNPINTAAFDVDYNDAGKTFVCSGSSAVPTVSSNGKAYNFDIVNIGNNSIDVGSSSVSARNARQVNIDKEGDLTLGTASGSYTPVPNVDLSAGEVSLFLTSGLDKVTTSDEGANFTAVNIASGQDNSHNAVTTYVNNHEADTADLAVNHLKAKTFDSNGSFVADSEAEVVIIDPGKIYITTDDQNETIVVDSHSEVVLPDFDNTKYITILNATDDEIKVSSASGDLVEGKNIHYIPKKTAHKLTCSVSGPTTSWAASDIDTIKFNQLRPTSSNFSNSKVFIHNEDVDIHVSSSDVSDSQHVSVVRSQVQGDVNLGFLEGEKVRIFRVFADKKLIYASSSGVLGIRISKPSSDWIVSSVPFISDQQVSIDKSSNGMVFNHIGEDSSKLTLKFDSSVVYPNGFHFYVIANPSIEAIYYFESTDLNSSFTFNGSREAQLDVAASVLSNPKVIKVFISQSTETTEGQEFLIKSFDNNALNKYKLAKPSDSKETIIINRSDNFNIELPPVDENTDAGFNFILSNFSSSDVGVYVAPADIEDDTSLVPSTSVSEAKQYDQYGEVGDLKISTIDTKDKERHGKTFVSDGSLDNVYLPRFKFPTQLQREGNESTLETVEIKKSGGERIPSSYFSFVGSNRFRVPNHGLLSKQKLNFNCEFVVNADYYYQYDGNPLGVDILKAEELDVSSLSNLSGLTAGGTLLIHDANLDRFYYVIAEGKSGSNVVSLKPQKPLEKSIFHKKTNNEFLELSDSGSVGNTYAYTNSLRPIFARIKNAGQISAGSGTVAAGAIYQLTEGSATAGLSGETAKTANSQVVELASVNAKSIDYYVKVINSNEIELYIDYSLSSQLTYSSSISLMSETFKAEPTRYIKTNFLNLEDLFSINNQKKGDQIAGTVAAAEYSEVRAHEDDIYTSGNLVHSGIHLATGWNDDKTVNTLQIKDDINTDAVFLSGRFHAKGALKDDSFYINANLKTVKISDTTSSTHQKIPKHRAYKHLASDGSFVLQDSIKAAPANISSITESSGTATATTSSAHLFETGDVVTISGANQSAYNSNFTVTVTGPTTFTFSVASATGTASGTIKALINVDVIYYPKNEIHIPNRNNLGILKNKNEVGANFVFFKPEVHNKDLKIVLPDSISNLYSSTKPLYVVNLHNHPVEVVNFSGGQSHTVKSLQAASFTSASDYTGVTSTDLTYDSDSETYSFSDFEIQLDGNAENPRVAVSKDYIEDTFHILQEGDIVLEHDIHNGKKIIVDGVVRFLVPYFASRNGETSYEEQDYFQYVPDSSERTGFQLVNLSKNYRKGEQGETVIGADFDLVNINDDGTDPTYGRLIPLVTYSAEVLNGDEDVDTTSFIRDGSIGFSHFVPVSNEQIDITHGTADTTTDHDYFVYGKEAPLDISVHYDKISEGDAQLINYNSASNISTEEELYRIVGIGDKDACSVKIVNTNYESVKINSITASDAASNDITDDITENIIPLLQNKILEYFSLEPSLYGNYKIIEESKAVALNKDGDEVDTSEVAINLFEGSNKTFNIELQEILSNSKTSIFGFNKDLSAREISDASESNKLAGGVEENLPLVKTNQQDAVLFQLKTKNLQESGEDGVLFTENLAYETQLNILLPLRIDLDRDVEREGTDKTFTIINASRRNSSVSSPENINIGGSASVTLSASSAIRIKYTYETRSFSNISADSSDGVSVLSFVDDIVYSTESGLYLATEPNSSSTAVPFSEGIKDIRIANTTRGNFYAKNSNGSKTFSGSSVGSVRALKHSLFKTDKDSNFIIKDGNKNVSIIDLEGEDGVAEISKKAYEKEVVLFSAESINHIKFIGDSFFDTTFVPIVSAEKGVPGDTVEKEPLDFGLDKPRRMPELTEGSFKYSNNSYPIGDKTEETVSSLDPYVCYSDGKLKKASVDCHLFEFLISASADKLSSLAGNGSIIYTRKPYDFVLEHNQVLNCFLYQDVPNHLDTNIFALNSKGSDYILALDDSEVYDIRFLNREDGSRPPVTELGAGKLLLSLVQAGGNLGGTEDTFVSANLTITEKQTYKDIIRETEEYNYLVNNFYFNKSYYDNKVIVLNTPVDIVCTASKTNSKIVNNSGETCGVFKNKIAPIDADYVSELEATLSKNSWLSSISFAGDSDLPDIAEASLLSPKNTLTSTSLVTVVMRPAHISFTGSMNGLKLINISNKALSVFDDEGRESLIYSAERADYSISKTDEKEGRVLESRGRLVTKMAAAIVEEPVDDLTPSVPDHIDGGGQNYNATYSPCVKSSKNDWFVRLKNIDFPYLIQDPNYFNQKEQDLEYRLKKRGKINIDHIGARYKFSNIFRIDTSFLDQDANIIDDGVGTHEAYKYGVSIFGDNKGDKRVTNFNVSKFGVPAGWNILHGLKLTWDMPERAIAFSVNTGHERLVKCKHFDERNGWVTLGGISHNKFYKLEEFDESEYDFVGSLFGSSLEVGKVTSSLLGVDNKTEDDADTPLKFQPTIYYNGKEYKAGERFSGVKGVYDYKIRYQYFATFMLSQFDAAALDEEDQEFEEALAEDRLALTVGEDGEQNKFDTKKKWTKVPDDGSVDKNDFISGRLVKKVARASGYEDLTLGKKIEDFEHKYSKGQKHVDIIVPRDSGFDYLNGSNETWASAGSNAEYKSGADQDITLVEAADKYLKFRIKFDDNGIVAPGYEYKIKGSVKYDKEENIASGKQLLNIDLSSKNVLPFVPDGTIRTLNESFATPGNDEFIVSSLTQLQEQRKSAGGDEKDKITSRFMHIQALGENESFFSLKNSLEPAFIPFSVNSGGDPLQGLRFNIKKGQARYQSIRFRLKKLVGRKLIFEDLKQDISIGAFLQAADRNLKYTLETDIEAIAYHDVLKPGGVAKLLENNWQDITTNNVITTDTPTYDGDCIIFESSESSYNVVGRKPYPVRVSVEDDTYTLVPLFIYTSHVETDLDVQNKITFSNSNKFKIVSQFQLDKEAGEGTHRNIKSVLGTLAAYEDIRDALGEPTTTLDYPIVVGSKRFYLEGGFVFNTLEAESIDFAKNTAGVTMPNFRVNLELSEVAKHWVSESETFSNNAVGSLAEHWNSDKRESNSLEDDTYSIFLDYRNILYRGILGDNNYASPAQIELVSQAKNLFTINLKLSANAEYRYLIKGNDSIQSIFINGTERITGSAVAGMVQLTNPDIIIKVKYENDTDTEDIFKSIIKPIISNNFFMMESPKCVDQTELINITNPTDSWPISSITESSGTATATTSSDHSFETGDVVTISGANQSAYNASFTVTDTGDTTFTFPVASGTGTASGTIKASSYAHSELDYFDYQIPLINTSFVPGDPKLQPYGSYFTENFNTITSNRQKADRLTVDGSPDENSPYVYTLSPMPTSAKNQSWDAKLLYDGGMPAVIKHIYPDIVKAMGFYNISFHVNSDFWKGFNDKFEGEGALFKTKPVHIKCTLEKLTDGDWGTVAIEGIEGDIIEFKKPEKGAEAMVKIQDNKFAYDENASYRLTVTEVLIVYGESGNKKIKNTALRVPFSIRKSNIYDTDLTTASIENPEKGIYEHSIDLINNPIIKNTLAFPEEGLTKLGKYEFVKNIDGQGSFPCTRYYMFRLKHNMRVVYKDRISRGGISKINITNPGKNYKLAPTVTINKPDDDQVGDTFRTATARAIIESGKLKFIEVVDSGVGYVDFNNYSEGSTELTNLVKDSKRSSGVIVFHSMIIQANLSGADMASFTAPSCITTSGSSSVTHTNVSNIVVGCSVSGAGIPADTKVISITSSTVFVISKNATAGGTVTLTFVFAETEFPFIAESDHKTLKTASVSLTTNMPPAEKQEEFGLYSLQYEVIAKSNEAKVLELKGRNAPTVNFTDGSSEDSDTWDLIQDQANRINKIKNASTKMLRQVAEETSEAIFTPDEYGDSSMKGTENGFIDGLYQESELDSEDEPVQTIVTDDSGEHTVQFETVVTPTKGAAIAIINDRSVANYRIINNEYANKTNPHISSFSKEDNPSMPLTFGLTPGAPLSSEVFNTYARVINNMHSITIEAPLYAKIKKFRQYEYRYIENMGGLRFEADPDSAYADEWSNNDAEIEDEFFELHHTDFDRKSKVNYFTFVDPASGKKRRAYFSAFGNVDSSNAENNIIDVAEGEPLYDFQEEKITEKGKERGIDHIKIPDKSYTPINTNLPSKINVDLGGTFCKPPASSVVDPYASSSMTIDDEGTGIPDPSVERRAAAFGGELVHTSDAYDITDEDYDLSDKSFVDIRGTEYITTSFENKIVFGCYTKGKPFLSTFLKTTREWTEYEIISSPEFTQTLPVGIREKYKPEESKIRCHLLTETTRCSNDKIGKVDKENKGFHNLCNDGRIIPGFKDPAVSYEYLFGLSEGANIIGPVETFHENSEAVVARAKDVFKITPEFNLSLAVYGDNKGRNYKVANDYGTSNWFKVGPCVHRCNHGIKKTLSIGNDPLLFDLRG